MVLAAAGMNNSGTRTEAQQSRPSEVAAKQQVASQFETRRMEQAKRDLAKQEKELAAREQALRRDEQKKHDESCFSQTTPQYTA